MHRKIDREQKKEIEYRIGRTSIAVSMSWYWVVFLSSWEIGDVFLYMTNQSVWFWKCHNSLLYQVRLVTSAAKYDEIYYSMFAE